MRSIAYRLDDFPGLGLTTVAVGVVGLVTVGLLAASVGNAASPGRLRGLYRGAVAAAMLGAFPFGGAVVKVVRRVLVELTLRGWTLQQFEHRVVHEVWCSLLIALLGAGIIAAPTIAAWLCTQRLATQHHDLPPRQLRTWAVAAGALVAAQWAWLTWVIATELWLRARGLAQGLVALAIMLATAAVAYAAVAWPLRAARRSPDSANVALPSFAEPSRFAACSLAPQPPDPLTNAPRGATLRDLSHP